jgi:hypothetical protein
MTKLFIQIDDEVREMNEVENTAYQKMQAKEILKQNEAAAKAAAKDSALAKLAALGLTPEEISAIS